MVKIKERDFVEIEYTGKLKDDNIVFDTTDEATAKNNKIYNKNAKYGPVIICAGENQILAGLDKELVGKDIGSYEISLKAENAFGKKTAKLIQLIPTAKFKKENILPMPGMQVNMDGLVGIIKTVSGGRTLVDFNHPLSGKDVVYNIKINRIVTNAKEKIGSYLKIALNLKNIKVEIEENTAKIKIEQNIPEKTKEKLSKKLMELVKIKKIMFI